MVEFKNKIVIRVFFSKSYKGTIKGWSRGYIKSKGQNGDDGEFMTISIYCGEKFDITTGTAYAIVTGSFTNFKRVDESGKYPPDCGLVIFPQSMKLYEFDEDEPFSDGTCTNEKKPSKTKPALKKRPALDLDEGADPDADF